GGSANMIGGSGAGNTIGHNTVAGVQITAPNSALVQGNFIGTDSSFRMLGNVTGVKLSADCSTIGGAGLGNTVGFNQTAIAIGAAGSPANSNTVQGNFIGTDQTTTQSIPNTAGITIDGSSNTIGGTAANRGNTIANNTATAVLVDSGSSNPIQENLIYSNGNAIFLNAA